MMMMKKISMFLFTFTSVILLLPACSPEKEFLNSSTAITNSADLHYNYAIPENMNDLVNRSDAVLKVKPSGSIDVAVINDIFAEDIEVTSHKVKVLEVYEGNLKPGATITVSEPFFLLKDKYIQSEGYTPMNMEREYIIFLQEAVDHNEELIYGITSMDFGKFSVEGESEKANYTTFDTVGELAAYDFLKENREHVELYDSLKREVLRAYKEE